MFELLMVILAVLGIAAANVIGPRIRVAPPLLLVIAGVLIGVLPIVPSIEIDPEWILVGVLPPLLYSAAVSMPTMDFRRDFTAISASAVLLVIISTVAMGFFFAWVLPDISLATGIALGAIVSPTDAVATSIARRVGVPGRLVAMLEGESMLNDATALVLLRSAIAAIGAGFSFGHVALNLVWAVVAAVAVGAVVGTVNLWVRARVPDATVNTAISFTVPYLAYLPAEELGASGLVAAVTAGLITGAGAARYLTPAHRISDSQNWHTVELLAEGGIFLLMGLELFGLISDVHEEHGGVPTAVWIGVVALALTVVVRALYVAPLVWYLNRRARRGTAMRPYLEHMDARISAKQRKIARAPQRPDADAPDGATPRRLRFRLRLGRRRRAPSDQLSTAAFAANPEAVQHYRNRITRALADIDYYAATPMGPKEGTIIVWAGLRGVLTLAAAQTLPADTPSRALLVLIAFVVAATSLMLQGGTLSTLIRALRLPETADLVTEQSHLRAELSRTAQQVMTDSDLADRYPWVKARLERQERDDQSDDDTMDRNLAYRAAYEKVRRDVIDAQRATLLEMRSTGTYNSSLLTHELRQLDAEEISLDLRSES
ncbi:cation:proton antiporter [Gordonia sp. CPCC 205515]|uniref:cation:proton antiporter n=1 Tax=Gordonia sp. CPCC 205515 TaxID=3140791 RepID=UPI003AF3D405